MEILPALGLLFMSAFFSGLTLGLMSLDLAQLELVIASGDPVQKRRAERILPVRRRGNLLLCTLLLGNTMVNAFLAILTESIAPGVYGAVFSTAFILIFGEIIPQSACSRWGLFIGSASVELVQLVTLLLFVVAYPLSLSLDAVLGKELGTIYSRNELKELFTMQVAAATTAAARSGTTTPEEAAADPADTLRDVELQVMTGALSLPERTAEQIMTPLSDVDAINEDTALDFARMQAIANSGHTRVPVFRAGTTVDGGAVRADAVVGLLSTKDLILIDPEDAHGVGTLMKYCGRSIATTWYDTPVAQLFRELKRGRSHLAFVQRVRAPPPPLLT